MKPEEFYQRLQEVHGITLSDEQKKQFDQYFHLLVEWNEKMNLTAITDEEGVYLKHFYDSLALGFHHELTDQTLCDVGAGAGFPSIPLKIVFPDLKVTIVDSLNKRITFLNTLVETLGLTDVQCFHDRAETFGQNKEFRASFDVVTARAVSALVGLVDITLPILRGTGELLALKGRSAREEIKKAKKKLNRYGARETCPIACSARERRIFTFSRPRSSTTS